MRPFDLDKLLGILEGKKKFMANDSTHTIAEMLLITDLIKYLETKAENDIAISPTSEWVKYRNDVEPHPWHCRNCNWSSLTAGYHSKFYNYCPNCGAKMKVELEETIL